MEKETIISTFIELGLVMRCIVAPETELTIHKKVAPASIERVRQAIAKEKQFNPWFTKANCEQAFLGIVHLLESTELNKFSAQYSYAQHPKTIALIMAGNIPLVGFHDLLCVVLSGNRALCKLSSTDNRIPLEIIQLLVELNPEMKNRIQVSIGPIRDFDAVIATGSNNSIDQLASYFGAYPHLFRKNRTSIAVLDGTETSEELIQLTNDCLLYFGMGCRNVSKLFVPNDFDLNRFFEALVSHGDIINHHKYGNNYDYHRTVFLMNAIPFLDNNCVMLKEDEGLHAPLSVIYFERYTNFAQVSTFIDQHEEEIQVVVGHQYTPFGKAQSPAIADFADGIDTMQWLNSLN